MSEKERREGIILHSMDYQENHKIVYLLTENGKESFLVPRGKGIKKGSNDTQNLTKINFNAKEKSLSKATNLEACDYYFEIKKDLNKMMVANYALELLHRFINPDADSERLYKMFSAFLETLEFRKDLKLLLLQFRIKMLYFLGIQPNFRTCVHCGKKENLRGLSLRYGGIECYECSSPDNINQTATEIIKHLYLDKSFSITLENIEVIDYLSEVIDEYFNIHFHENLKSIKMLKELKLY